MSRSDHDHLTVIVTLLHARKRRGEQRRVVIAIVNEIVQGRRIVARSAPKTASVNENGNEIGIVIAKITTGTVDGAVVGREGVGRADEERDEITIQQARIGRWQKEWDFERDTWF